MQPKKLELRKKVGVAVSFTHAARTLVSLPESRSARSQNCQVLLLIKCAYFVILTEKKLLKI